MTIYVEEQEVKFGAYPNGEAIVPSLPHGPFEHSRVRLHWTGDHDLLQLALIKGALDQAQTRSTLFIDYMPYSRMDREQDGHCFSLRYVCEQINAMGFLRVFVVEPHSQVTVDLLKRSEAIWATARLTPVAMRMMGFDKAHDYLVLPDAGAYKRYSELVPELNDCNIVVLKKDRTFDPSVGGSSRINSISIDHRVMRGLRSEHEATKALIIDDLSSRGGTFVGAAQVMRFNMHCAQVNLLVTHMEPAGLLGDLRHKLDRVFITDTMDFPRPIPHNFELLSRSQWS